MKKAIIVTVFIALAVLHQDLWNWDNDDFVFDFLPVGLAYHAGYSIVAAIFWAPSGEIRLAEKLGEVGKRRGRKDYHSLIALFQEVSSDSLHPPWLRYQWRSRRRIYRY